MSIAGWAVCNCATKRRSAGSRPSYAMIAGRRHDERDVGAGFCLDQLATGRKLRVLTIVDFLALLTAAGAAVHLPQQRRRGSTGRGLQGSGIPGNDPRRSRQRVRIAILTCRPTSAASNWTSRGPASRPTMLHRGLQRPLPGRMSQGPLVPLPGRQEKVDTWRSALSSPQTRRSFAVERRTEAIYLVLPGDRRECMCH